MALK
jgi:hypothetical protein